MTKTETFIPVPLIGSASGGNKGAFHWSYDKLACLGNGTEVFVIDTKSLEVVQVLSGHTSTITHVLWLPAGRQFCGLVSSESKLSNRDIISADINGQVAVWDALKGQQVGAFGHPEGSRSILDMRIPIPGSDLWVRTKIYILYAGNVLTIYDYVHGSSQFVPVTNPALDNLGITDQIVKFCSDPYHASQYSSVLAFLSFDGSVPSVSVSKFWDCVKDPKIVLHKRILLNEKSSNQANTTGNSPSSQMISRSTSSSSISSNLNPLLDASKRQISSSSSIRKLVSDIIVGPTESTLSSSSSSNPANYQQSQFMVGSIMFHPGIKDVVIVSTETSIYYLNIQFMTVLHTFSIDKQHQGAAAPIVQIIPTKSRPCLFTLHENGTLFLRKYSISGVHTLTVQLETICYNDNPRFSNKKMEVIGCVVHPIEENSVIMYLSDGRLLKYELVDMKSTTSIPIDYLKPHLTTPSTPYPVPTTTTTSTTPCIIGFGEESHQQDMINQKLKQSHTSPAPIILSNVVKSILDVEIDSSSLLSLQLKRVTHSFGQFTVIKTRADLLVAGTTSGFVIVLKIVDHRLKALKKFTTHSSSPVSGIEFVSDSEILTYSNLSFSANPKCELILTEIWTGASKALKLDEKHHIQTLKISPMGQYFVLVYKNGAGPCELWDLPRRQLIKCLPNKLPAITCIHWREHQTTNNEKPREEMFYMTDLSTFLFTFRVEGNRFLNATCVKLEHTAHIVGIPTALFSREDMVYRADSNAVLVVYNTSKKTASPSTSVGRGPLLGMAKVPGQDNYVLQFPDNLILWDFSGLNPKKIKILHSGNLKTSSIAVLQDWLAYVPKGSNGVRLLSLDLHFTTPAVASPPTISQFHFPYFMNATEKAFKILSICQQPNSCIADLLLLGKEFGSRDEYYFWSVVNAKWNKNKNKQQHEGDGLQDIDVFCDRPRYKDVLVKTAQCVWASDFHKREEVAKILLWTGESERAAEILLDTEPSDASSYVLNGLKASVAVGANNLPEQAKAVLKIIATNLIACGDMDGGLELLCLLQKHHEACKYVESSNEWTKAILLCKTALNDKNAEESLCKYAQFINSKKCAYKAATIYIFCEKYDRAIEVLFGARLRHLSYLLLFYCIKQGVPISISDHIQTAIQLDFARWLFECTLPKEAIQFCHSLGEKGNDLKQELEILSS